MARIRERSQVREARHNDELGLPQIAGWRSADDGCGSSLCSERIEQSGRRRGEEDLGLESRRGCEGFHGEDVEVVPGA